MQPEALPSPDAEHQADFELVETILDGDESAWHAFVERYAGLISHVARRYMSDEDEVANVQVQVLEALRKGKLGTYRGRSSLATWLILVSRNATTDALRHRFGRRDIPHGLKQLDDLHREVFRLYYVEGMTFAGTLQALRRRDGDLDADGLLDALHVIDDRLTDRTLRRITYELASQSVVGASGRILEYCDHIRWEAEDLGRTHDPLDRLVARDAEARAQEALALVAQLPPEDRRILSLRFDKGMRAKDIAEKLDLSGQRKVFTILDRITRRLRRLRARNVDQVVDRAGNTE